MTDCKNERGKDFIDWIEKFKTISDGLMEKMNSESISQNITLFDKRYSDNVFELSIKVRKKNSDD